jgi:hypothetical protein
VHHLRTFGCIMYVWNTMSHLKKLEDCGRKMIFVNYESGSKVYRAYDPITNRVHVTRDVAFDKQAQWDCGSGGDDGKPGGGDDGKPSGGDDVFMVEYTTTGPVAPMADGADEAPTEESLLPAGAGDTKVDDDVDDENLDANHDDDAQLRFRSMSDILKTLGFAPRALVVEELHVVSSDEPTSFTEAEHNLSWKKVMMEEIVSIEENGTWSLANLSPGRKPIGVKWVFKVK